MISLALALFKTSNELILTLAGSATHLTMPINLKAGYLVTTH